MEILLCHGESRKRARFEVNEVNKQDLDAVVFRLLGLKSCKYQIFQDKYNEYCDLDEYDEIRNCSKIRILTPELEKQNNFDTNEVRDLTLSIEDLSTLGPPMNLRTVPWRMGQFKLSLDNFDGVVRDELEKATELYNSNSKMHTMSWRLKHELCNNVEKYLLQFTMYPTEKQYDDVCATVITEFPCLASSCDYDSTGYGHLRIMFYNRMSTKRRSSLDEPECSLNAGIGKQKSGRQTIRAKKGEVNFLPKILAPHTSESLALKRDEILLARQAIPRDNEQILDLMDSTFPRRRHELLVSDKLRKLEIWFQLWPELANPDELRREMQRLTCEDFPENLLRWMTGHLDSLSMLASKSRIKRLSLGKDTETAPMEALQEIPYLLADRATFYLLAPGDDENTDYLTSAHIVASSNHTFSIKGEGKILVSDLPTFDMSCWVLLAIYYCFDLKYPRSFQKSLHFFQHLCGIRNGPCPREVKQFFCKIDQKKRNVSV